MCLKESGKVIGNIYLSEQDFNTWELGYVFNSNYQGKGFAIEASKALINHMFTEKDAHRVIAMCNPENISFWKSLERLGMRLEGHLIKNIYFYKDNEGNPIWQDTYEYWVLKDEWELNSKNH